LIDENSKKEPDKDQPENPDQAQALDLQTFSQMVDKITIKDDAVIPGRININTAPKPVLVALLEGDRILADSIINQRNKSHSGMTSIGELLDMKELSVKTFKKIADHITTRSSVYQVNCMAQSHLTRAIHQVTAIVDRGQSPATILYWHQGDEF
jgi:type II secretory pathway component PulK